MILVIGDVMIDKYTYGRVERISPEAPVPVLFVEESTAMLGGAGNVARNIVALGQKAALLSVCGKDEWKSWLEEECKREGIRPYLFADPERKTTVKHRFIARPFNHYLLRVDYEDLCPIPPLMENAIIKVLDSLDFTFVVISDYGKGMITPKLARYLIQKTRVLVDAKPDRFKLYEGAFLIKPNLSEAARFLGESARNEDQHVAVLAEGMAKALKSKVVITRGSEGATLFNGERVVHVKGPKREIYDVAGAGDTFIAALAVSLAEGKGLEEATVIANIAAGLVVEKLGTAVVKRDELSAALSATQKE